MSAVTPKEQEAVVPKDSGEGAGCTSSNAEVVMSVDAFRRRFIAATEDLPRGRGRPKKNRVSDLNRIQYEVACEVEREVLSASRKTGAITRAVKRVADRHRGLSQAYVRKAWQRQVLAREWTRAEFQLEQQMEEIRRRMLGLPSDVQDRLKLATVPGLLGFLRLLGIDGTAPQALVDLVRSEDFLSQKGG